MKPAVTIKSKSENKSKTQIKYEKLLSAIEEQRRYQTNVEEGLQRAYDTINSELTPLMKERHLLSRSYLLRLEELSIEIGIGKYNRECFENYMMDELDTLLDFFGHQDTMLSDLYQKYTQNSLDDIAEDDDIMNMIKSLGNNFGFEIDVKEFLLKGEKAYFEEHKETILKNLNKESFEQDDAQKSAGKERKKIKKDDESGELAKDARSIYIRLVKKFHPDLEKDPVLHQQHTEIIKKVTEAYQENDFFTLLKLQITHLDDNEDEAIGLADDMMKRYNKILKKQLDGLNAQINESNFSSGAIIADFIDKNGKFSPQKFAAKRRAIEKENTLLVKQIADSKKRPKGWFKDQISFIKNSLQQSMMKDIFSNMFNDFDY